MGCSSSARSRPEELPPRAAPGAHTAGAEDREAIADQTQLDAEEDLSLASEQTKLGKHLLGEEAAAVVLAVEGKMDSVSKREEPEGTEPLSAGAEESCQLPPAWPEESKELSPPAPAEDAGAEDRGLLEGCDSSVVEIMQKVHLAEEDQLTEETAHNKE